MRAMRMSLVTAYLLNAAPSPTGRNPGTLPGRRGTP